MLCEFCKKPVDENAPYTYREVKSWVTGPKLDGPVLRRQTGKLAHGECIKKQILGQAPDQEPIVPEVDFSDPPTWTQGFTANPGDITASVSD